MGTTPLDDDRCIPRESVVAQPTSASSACERAAFAFMAPKRKAEQAAAAPAKKQAAAGAAADVIEIEACKS